MTAARSSGSFTDTDTNSKLRERYMRYVASRAGNSPAHGAHHVAQKLTSSSLPVPFWRSFFRSSAPAMVSGTSALPVSAWATAVVAAGSSPFTRQPLTRVRATGAALPASTASMAFRASGDLTASSRRLSSIRPWYLQRARLIEDEDVGRGNHAEASGDGLRLAVGEIGIADAPMRRPRLHVVQRLADVAERGDPGAPWRPACSD